MPATTKPQTKDTSEAIEAELETLQDRHGQATSGVEEARRRLDALASRRAVIATDAYFGDAPAVEEMAALDVETSTLTRSVSLALDAATALEGDIKDARERLTAERARASSAEVRRLRQERQAVRGRALEAADELLAVLVEDQRLHAKMISAAQNGATVAGLESIARNHTEADLHSALREKLRHYASAWVG